MQTARASSLSPHSLMQTAQFGTRFRKAPLKNVSLTCVHISGMEVWIDHVVLKVWEGVMWGALEIVRWSIGWGDGAWQVWEGRVGELRMAIVVWMVWAPLAFPLLLVMLSQAVSWGLH